MLVPNDREKIAKQLVLHFENNKQKIRSRSA